MNDFHLLGIIPCEPTRFIFYTSSRPVNAKQVLQIVDVDRVGRLNIKLVTEFPPHGAGILFPHRLIQQRLRFMYHI